MKRMHIHVGVENLNQNIRFYNALFGAQRVASRTRKVSRNAVSRLRRLRDAATNEKRPCSLYG